jgi:hypothetical protein
MKRLFLLSVCLPGFTGIGGQSFSSGERKSFSNIANKLHDKMICSGDDDRKPRFTVFRKTVNIAGLNTAAIPLFVDTYSATCFYTTREGTQVISPTDSYGFSYLKVEVLGGNVLLEQIKLIDCRYPYFETGSFACMTHV